MEMIPDRDLLEDDDIRNADGLIEECISGLAEDFEPDTPEKAKQLINYFRWRVEQEITFDDIFKTRFEDEKKEEEE